MERKLAVDERDYTFENSESLGQKLFRLRDYTPIPLLLLLFLVGTPTVLTAILGTLLIVGGELFRIYSVSFIGGVSRTRSLSVGEQLVTSGPFAWVRNPLYIGNFFITLGFAVYSAKLWFIVLAVAFFAFQYYFICQYEERLLDQKFGTVYFEYKAKVPSWIPKSIPALDDIEWPASFSAAIRSEKRTLSSIFLIWALVVFFS